MNAPCVTLRNAAASAARPLALATMLLAFAATAQPPPPQGPLVMPGLSPGPIPRTGDGKPDLSGIWQVGFDLDAYFPLATLERTEPVGFTGGMPNYRPDAAARVRQLATKDDPVLQCLPWGILRQPGIPFPIQLVQTRDQVVVLYEYFHSYRVIPTDGRAHRRDLIPSYLGDPAGRWDGDTLVVDVVGFNDETWIGEPGTFHTEEMHVVERYTLVNENALRWQATVEDPAVLSEPWTLELFLSRAKPGTQLIESICTDISTSQHIRDEPR
jgi:hypothetical protein